MKLIYIILGVWVVLYIATYLETYEHPESIHIIHSGAQP